MEHHVNTLLLHEELVDIKGGASGVSKTESSANILLVNFPQRRVIIHSLTGDTEKLCLRSEGDVWVWHDPLFFASNFHQSQFLDLVVLSVENANGGSSSINSQSGTNERSSGLSLEVFSLPNTINGSDREVAVNHGWTINWVKSDEVATIFVKSIEL